MPLSLNDPTLQATFEQAFTPRTLNVTAGGQPHTIVTPFPSPQDWRDTWIYFLMIDRFNRSDGAPPVSLPYDKPFGRYQGGTFNGVRAHLPYIKDLGAGAIWLTPVLKNRVSDAHSYHGYGIQDFLQPEPRFASAPGKGEDELRALVDEAHALGLYVIFDVVLNHAGDLFAYRDFGSSAPGSTIDLPIEWRDEQGTARPEWPVIDDVPILERTADGLAWPAELQRNGFFRRRGKGGEAGGDFESLKEFVTDVRKDAIFPVRNALILAYQYAIGRYDVDGYRIDTLKFVERDFARVFGNAVREYALSIGKKNFFTFGEVFDNEERIAEFIGRNTQDADDLVGVDSALDFPLFFRLPGVAKGFVPPTELNAVYRRRREIERHILSSHGEAGRFFVTFLDNHDMKERFRPAFGDGPDQFDPQVVLAIALLFGIQGIPCLYYGTEQGLHGRGDSDRHVREALWGKPNAFDVTHPFYQSIRALSVIRDRHPALRYGRQYFRPISGDGHTFGLSPFAPGVVAFSRILNNTEVLVVANASPQEAFEGHVIIDLFLHAEGDVFRIVNKAGAFADGAAETRSGLAIAEPDGTFATGPARTIRVNLQPMEVQILTPVSSPS
jgi:glycosidase